MIGPAEDLAELGVDFLDFPLGGLKGQALLDAALGVIGGAHCGAERHGVVHIQLIRGLEGR